MVLDYGLVLQVPADKITSGLKGGLTGTLNKVETSLFKTRKLTQYFISRLRHCFTCRLRYRFISRLRHCFIFKLRHCFISLLEICLGLWAKT
jgi:hypothetical protein